MAEQRIIRRATNPTVTSNDIDTELAKGILNDEYALIIGSEAIFNRDMPKTQGTGDSMFRIYNAIAEIHQIDGEFPLTEHGWHILLAKKGIDTQAICKNAWEELIKSGSTHYDEQTNKPDKNLCELIDTCFFRTVFTTCIDDTLEQYLRTIWEDRGEELTVYNFQQRNDVSRYNKQREEEESKYGVKRPCIVYLFGKIGDSTTLGTPIEFVFNEDEALKATSEYVKASDAIREFLEGYLYKRKILSIGCHYDDWRFRFFWYSLRKGLSHLAEGTVVYNFDPKDTLYQYLEDRYVHVEKDSRAFMHRIAEKLKSPEMFEGRAKAAKGVFLSYDSRDFTVAYQLFRTLHKENINVWIDREELHHNDKYNEDIRQAINSCGIFMPVLSDNISEKLENFTGDPKGEVPVDDESIPYYIRKEWVYAKSLNKPIFPIIIGNYSPRNEYHKKFRDLVGIPEEKDKTLKNLCNEKEIIESLKTALADLLYEHR